jgi:Asp-tRNA(Asn)/Glu-tRNA(Gln) amidotransferase A subunit family amidase
VPLGQRVRSVARVMQERDPDGLAFVGAAEQARLLAANGSLTAPALLEFYLERIARLDPELGAYRAVLANRPARMPPPRRPGSGLHNGPPLTRPVHCCGSWGTRSSAAIRTGKAALAARIQSIFDDVDVVITPGTATGPSRIGAYDRRGGVTTLASVSGRVPFHAMWNATGQPAVVVPWALDGDGLPLSVQLVGKPFDEATLLALSAQIEAARPWAPWRPPVS